MELRREANRIYCQPIWKTVDMSNCVHPSQLHTCFWPPGRGSVRRGCCLKQIILVSQQYYCYQYHSHHYLFLFDYANWYFCFGFFIITTLCKKSLESFSYYMYLSLLLWKSVMFWLFFSNYFSFFLSSLSSSLFYFYHSSYYYSSYHDYFMKLG